MAPSKRRGLEARPVIPLAVPKDEDMEFIKHRRSEVNNGVTEEIQEKVPKLTDSATPYHMLRFFNAFTQVRRHMQWTTGPRLFQRFHMHLEGTHLTAWEDQINGVNETVANFNDQYAAFKANLLEGYKYLDQMDYLRQVKKTKDQSPKEFLRLVRASETLACQLPDAPNNNAGFTEVERRRNFLHAMPIDWQTKFIEANLRAEDETLNDMRTYFERLQQLYPFEERRNEEGNTERRNNHRNNRNNRNRGNNGDRHQPSGNNRGNSRGGRGANESRNTTNRIQNTDPCPLPGHSNHTWGQCRANRYNDESRNSRSNNNNQGNRNQGSRNNNREANNNERDTTEGNTRNERNNDNRNSNRGQGESHYFSGPTTNDSIETDPESFFYKEDVQQEMEEPLVNVVIEDEKKGIVTAENDVLSETDRMEMTPTTIAIVTQINDVKTKIICKSLLDPGGSNVLIKHSSLPKGVQRYPISNQNFKTTAGTMQVSSTVYLHNIILPEFSYSRRIKTFKAYVFDNDAVPYDIIFGRDFLNGCRIDLCGSDLTCRWYGDVIPYHKPDFFKDNERIRPILTIPPARVQQWEANATELTASVNTKVTVEDVVAQQTHLSQEQQDKLLQVLKRYPTLFSGKLGKYKRRKFHIELKDDAVPYHCKAPYPVAAVNMPILKEELKKQVENDILERVGESEWGMPMMCIPKKDGHTIRTIDDFRELNKQMKRKVYPLPKIQDIFHRRKGYKYASQLDLTKMYYTFELDEESSWVCILVTPFGKYRRKRLPMGLKQSPDWAQAAIEIPLIEADLLRECVEAYIDDVGVFSNSFEEHLLHLDKTLFVLQEEGFTINPTKCVWCVQEMEWLGHWLTPTAIKPLKKKIKGVLQLDRPQTVTQLRHFLGMINYYRDFWQRRSHVLAPLTALTKHNPKKSLPWNDDCTKAFNQIKALLTEEVLLYYPDPNKPFYIEPDASKYQLGATIYQYNGDHKQPVAFFSRKLAPAQTRYPASDLEALCITEVFEEYRSILYGAEIIVRTDHKNLTQRDLKSHRLLHWRLLLEEFSPTFEYLPGTDNHVADALSRLPMTPISEEEAETRLRECLMFYPEEVDQFPLNFPDIATAQQNDPAMLPLADQDDFDVREFNGTELICKLHQNEWKIVLPEELIPPTLDWYHIVLGHCGITRLETTLLNHLWFANARQRITNHIEQCNHCSRFKFNGPGQGHLPPRNDVGVPWEEVAVDTIGPWKVLTQQGELHVHALTIIDTTTTLSECVRVENGTASHAAMLFRNTWLARYPRPTRCVHDQGSEFIGYRFQNMLATEGIEAVPITVQNPQANSICERMHKTIEDALNTYLRHQVPEDIETALDLIDALIAAAQRAIRSAVHSTLRISPGALVFQRDMMLPIPLMADYNLLRDRRQALIDYNNARENRRRQFKDYQVGDQILILSKEKGKLKEKTEGPYTVSNVHVNGTITIQRGPGITERLSIRRVKPY